MKYTIPITVIVDFEEIIDDAKWMKEYYGDKIEDILSDCIKTYFREYEYNLALPQESIDKLYFDIFSYYIKKEREAIKNDD